MTDGRKPQKKSNPLRSTLDALVAFGDDEPAKNVSEEVTRRLRALLDDLRRIDARIDKLMGDDR